MKIFKRKNLKLSRILLGFFAVALAIVPAVILSLSSLKVSAATETDAKLYEHFDTSTVTYTDVSATSAGQYLTGKITSGNYRYVFGTSDANETTYYSGIDFGGLTITGGNVLFEINSTVTMKGPIYVNGGNLVVRITDHGFDTKYNEDSGGGAIFKRHAEASLRNATDANGGYIPVNAAGYNADDEYVYQYSGSLFIVKSGTVEIVGGKYDSSERKYTYVDSGKYAYVSGAGQFSVGISSDTLANAGHEFPATYSTYDDVQAEGPLFLINDGGTDAKNNHATVRLYHVSLRHNYNVYFTGVANSDGTYSAGNEPYNGEYTYTTLYSKDATYGTKSETAAAAMFKSTNVYNAAGAIFVSGTAPQVYMLNSEINRCFSATSSAAIHLNGKGGDVDLVNTNVLYCSTLAKGSATGGTIRAMGSNETNLSFTGCEYKNNCSANSAGAIQWGSMNTSEALVISDCVFSGNASNTGAAAIACMSRLELSNTKITRNMTNTGNGGGLTIDTWNSSTSYDSFQLLNDSVVTIDAGVEISGNSAKYGGGIYLRSKLIVVGIDLKDSEPEKYREFTSKGYYDENNEFVSKGDYNVSLYIEDGAVIENNTASNNGGGIYMTRTYYEDYIVKIYMSGGSISGNTSSAAGGGAYLYGKELDFVMSGGEIFGNSSVESGGAAYVASEGNFIMSGGDVYSNTTEKNAGAVAVNNGNFVMSGGSIYDNTAASGQGGAVTVYTGNFTMSDGTIRNNTAETGGAVYVNQGSFDMSGGAVYENTATAKSGGAVFVNGASGTFKMWKGEDGTGDGGEIYSNSAANDGGGVGLDSGSFEMLAGTIRDNTAEYHGGGVSVDYGSFTMSGGTISGNTATLSVGGGVYLEGTETKKATFTMSGGTISGNNAAATYGGGVGVKYGDFTMSAGTISGNTATTNGGGVHVEATKDKPATFTMSGGTISGNTCVSLGGGVRLSYGTFIMDGGLITGNHTTHASAGRGGGVSLEHGSFTMNSGTVSKNYTSYRGGGIEVRYGSFIMNGGTIGGDTAADGNYNTASGIGGGVCVWGNTGDFVMTDGKIKNNYSKENAGGGVYLSGGDFTMSGGEISYNYAERGGGLYIYQGDFIMEDGLVDRNYATNFSSGTGGGIWVYKGDFKMNGGSLTNNYTTNTSGGHGGAVCVQGGYFEMTEGTLSGNYSAANGGAVAVLASLRELTDSDDSDDTRVYTDAVAKFTMSGGTISGNGKNSEGTVVTVHGGAVYVAGGDFEMNGGTISENAAKTNGGAVCIDEITMVVKRVYESSTDDNGKTVWNKTEEVDGTLNGSFSMTAGTLSENSAAKYGGAVYVSEGSFTITVADGKTCLISKNSATTSGGAVYVHLGNFEMTGTVENLQITENTVTNSHGGAVYVRGNGTKGNFAMNGGKIADNEGKEATSGSDGSKGGAVFVYLGTFTMKDGEISGNTTGREGGAVYVDGNGTYGSFIMEGGVIKDNSTSTSGGIGGGAVYLWRGSFKMTNGTITGNFANTSGGAVYVAHGSFTMENGEISANSANNYGGAVYIVGGSFEMKGGKISKNYCSRNGGAVYVQVGSLTVDDVKTLFNASFTMSDGEISKNGINSEGTVVTVSGGAVYVNGGSFTMSGGTLSGNAATDDGGAVYLCTDTVTITNNEVTEAYECIANFTMTAGTLSANESGASGGAVYVNEGSFSMSGGKLSGNSSEENGGAVYVNLGNFTISGDIEATLISGNTAAGHGGAVFVWGDGTNGIFTMSGGKINGNQGTTPVVEADSGSKGGAVYVYKGQFVMNDGEISGNTAEREAGAVFLDQGSVEMHGGIISGNEINSTLSGGAVYVYNGNFTVYNGEISGNSSPLGNAGAACVDGGNFTIYGGTVTQNTAKLSGGAILVCNGGSFIMTSDPDAEDDDPVYDITISYNYAEGDGGAVYVDGGNFTMDRGTIEYNGRAFTVDGEEITAGDAVTQNGGAVYVNLGNFTMTDGLVTENRSIANGGAVYVLGAAEAAASATDDYGVFTMSGGTLSYNHSTAYGGAVCLRYGSFTMSADAAVSYNSCDKSGGAIAMWYASFTMENGTVNNNSAPNESGGAVYIVDGSFTMNNGTITANSAKNNGGAVRLSGGNFVMSDGTVSYNVACWGGAVHLEEGNFTMNGGSLLCNYNVETEGAISEKRGGAVYVLGDGTTETGVFTFNGGIIENNGKNGSDTFTRVGGAVYVDYGNFIMRDTADDGFDTIIRGNVALEKGGAVYVKEGNFTMHSGTVTKNGFITEGTAVTAKAGAVYIENGNFIMNGGTISDNLAESDGAIRVVGNGIQEDPDDQLGIFTMNGGVISGNVATTETAGAIRVDSGKFVMTAGTITANSSKEKSGGAISLTTGTFEMSGGTISNNSAVNNGGAVYMSNGNFTMTGGTITGNTAKWGGAVYLSGGVFNMSGDEENTVILQNTAYVEAGAVFVSSGNFKMNGGLITENVNTSTDASNGAGAIFVSGGNFEMTAGTISYNTSGTYAGAIMVENGSFTMTSGTISYNTSRADGGAVYVVVSDGYTGTSVVTIGVEGCYGDAALEGHTSCPRFYGNSAVNGGAIALYGSTPTFHCGSIVANTASENGGGVYVKNASITVNYANIERNSAKIGGGIYVETESAQANVTVDSGVIISNTANYGGGIAVRATVDGDLATIIIGKEDCDGADDSEHKHPNISDNIATHEGGGLSLISIDSDTDTTFNGISFTMYCGSLQGNVANQNVPTGNVFQEGGSLSVSGQYTIDNATVVNGTYLRPDIGTQTVDIIYHYEVRNSGETADEKTTTITVGYDDSDLMKINLPSALPIDNPLGEGTLVLVRWERVLNETETLTYECGSQYTLNSTTVGEGTTQIVFYAVWILQGTGFAENPIVSSDEVYSHKTEGLGAAAVEMGNYFTVQFAVSECDPSKFDERILSFNNALMNGTTVIMIDITTDGVKEFYYYTFTGEQTEVNLSQFIKLGSPNETWSSTLADDSNKTVEEFLFIFDFTKTADLYMGALQITLTRTYADEDLAPIVQVGSCSVVEREKPAASVPDTDYKVGDEFEITYNPGFIADNIESMYYNDYVSYVFTSSDVIPTESYLVDEDGNRYYVNRTGSITVPLGLARETHTKKLTLISPYLIGAGEGIELKVSVRATRDADRPLSSPRIASMYITFAEKPIPAVDISVDNLIYYTDSLPDSVAVSVNTLNVEGYTLEWSTLKASGRLYEDTELISVSEAGILTFSGDITEGVYRIKLTVKDEFGNAVAEAVQNIAVLVRAVTVSDG